MTKPTLTAEQVKLYTVDLDWSTPDGDPAAGWKLTRNVAAAGEVTVLTAAIGDLRAYTDDLRGLGVAFGASIAYIVTDNDSTDASDPASVTYGETGDCDPGTPQLAADAIRYTSLAAVKARLEVTGAGDDAAITQAIIAGEIAIDVELNRDFPNQCIPDIPPSIVQAAENLGVAIYRATDSPFGVVGSDDYLGELEVTEIVRRELARSPLLRGYRAAFGIA